MKAVPRDEAHGRFVGILADHKGVLQETGRNSFQGVGQPLTRGGRAEQIHHDPVESVLPEGSEDFFLARDFRGRVSEAIEKGVNERAR